MKAASYVARMIRRLEVTARAMQEAASAMEASGQREPDGAKRLYREWLNDTLVLEGAEGCRMSSRDPDGSFLSWVRQRIADPFQVTVRAHDAARAAHGSEAALLFSEVRWRQEVAWARRMRASDNDRIAVLAEMWLTAARRDVAKLFRGVVDVYAEEALTEASYASSAFHMLTEDDILSGGGDEAHWRPLWLRFAEREFGRLLNPRSQAQITQLAARCRETELRERTARRRNIQAATLRARRPSLMVAVLTSSLDLGLSSDDLAGAEAEFLAAVETGELDLSDRPRDAAWRVFLGRLPPWAGRAALPGPEEKARRLSAIEQLPPDWASSLPPSFRDIGAGDDRTLVAWYDALNGRAGRPAPMDPAVDYGLWLVEGIEGSVMRTPAAPPA